MNVATAALIRVGYPGLAQRLLFSLIFLAALFIALECAPGAPRALSDPLRTVAGSGQYGRHVRQSRRPLAVVEHARHVRVGRILRFQPIFAAGRHRLVVCSVLPSARPPMVQFGFASDIADLAAVLSSVGGVTSAIRTVAINRSSPSESFFWRGRLCAGCVCAAPFQRA